MIFYIVFMIHGHTLHPIGRPVSPLILQKQLKVEGFLVARWLKDWPAAFKEMSQWIQEVHISL